MNITERAAKVLQEIDDDLALAGTATDGEWYIDFATVRSKTHGPICALNNPREYAEAKWKSDATFIVASRNGWPTALRCLKTAIKEMMTWHNPDIDNKLATLCDQWEAMK